MEKFIYRENLAPFKTRLADGPDESDRPVLLKLLAQQDAKDSPRPPRSKS
jgi:hypothetical protein